jgi:hypothetical protein
MNFNNENEMRPLIHSFVESQNYQVFDEKRLFSRKIDVVGIRKNEVCAIEIKIHDWRRAIEQAFLNLRIADYSYVALPEMCCIRLNSRLANEAHGTGIGLIRVDGYAKEVIKPEPSNRVQPLLREKFLAQLSVG